MNQLLLWLFLLTFPYVFSQDTETEVCQTCACNKSSDDEVLTVNCTARNLHHMTMIWPQNIKTKLIKASFTGNDFSTLEPMMPTNLTLEIILSKCDIQDLKPKLFYGVPNIVFLDLSYNKLEAKHIILDNFQTGFNGSSYTPIALEHLDLSYNKIHSLNANLFKLMHQLKHLNLEGNDFVVLNPQTQLAMASLKKLQRLNLAHNGLTEMIPGAIQSHENLTELDLSYNQLDFVPRPLATVSGSLQVLKIDGNPIWKIQAETFLGLKKIIELSANNLTKLREIGGNAFETMPKLKILNLNNNFELHHIDREAFGVNQSIEEFYVNNNNLYEINFELLAWDKLSVFEFNDNPWDCSCDLFKISEALSKKITRNENSPLCADPRTERYLPVYHLKSDICDYKPRNQADIQIIHYHLSVIKIALIALSTILSAVTLVALALGIVRYRKYNRALNYPYANTQVSYERVAVDPRF